MLSAWKEIDCFVKKLGGIDNRFTAEGAAIYEAWHSAVLAEGTVYSETDRTLTAWPVGGARRLVVLEVGSDSQAD